MIKNYLLWFLVVYTNVVSALINITNYATNYNFVSILVISINLIIILGYMKFMPIAEKSNGKA